MNRFLIPALAVLFTISAAPTAFAKWKPDGNNGCAHSASPAKPHPCKQKHANNGFGNGGGDGIPGKSWRNHNDVNR